MLDSSIPLLLCLFCAALPAKSVRHLARISTFRAILHLPCAQAGRRTACILRRVGGWCVSRIQRPLLRSSFVTLRGGWWRRRRPRVAARRWRRARVDARRRRMAGIDTRRRRNTGIDNRLWRSTGIDNRLWRRGLACVRILHCLFHCPLDPGFFLSFPAMLRLGRFLDLPLPLHLRRRGQVYFASGRVSRRPNHEGGAEDGCAQGTTSSRTKHGARWDEPSR